MAVYPKVDKPYMFVIHQCSRPRAWTPEERRLLKEIGRRLEDGLTSLLVFRNLRESEAKLRDAQRIARLGNWEWDIAHNKLWWSDEVFRIFDIAPEEFGATLEAFISAVHPNDRERVRASVKRALEHESKRWQIDYRIARADGSVRVVHEEAEAVFDQAGQPLKRRGTVQDITERKRADERIKSQLEELQRWQDVMLGREDRVQELKREINELCRRLGETVRYPSQEAGSQDSETVEAKP
jgi:PAS domain S-box-containing protein